jgi:molybdate transport system regulatory protein
LTSVGDIALKLKAQVLCGEEIAFGPGKADLLIAIDTHGSISAAARALGISYRRAWLMVDTMNRCWRLPLVESKKGGRTGAKVTVYGKKILFWYIELTRDMDNIRTSGSAILLIEEMHQGRFFIEDESS